MPESSKAKSTLIEEAVAILTELSKVKFVESIDVSINLGVDPRKSDQVVTWRDRAANGTGKDVRVAVFAQGEKAEEAKAAGAEVVGMDDLAVSIKAGTSISTWQLHSRCHARCWPAWPNSWPSRPDAEPRLGTVTPDVGEAVRNAKAGQVRYRTDKNGIIHGGVGKVGFEAISHQENIEALLSDLRKAKPASAKGTYVKRCCYRQQWAQASPSINLHLDY